MGASIPLQALSPPRTVFFPARRPGTEPAPGARSEALATPWLSCSGPGGSQGPRGLGGQSPPIPQAWPGTLSRPLPELWVEKAVLRAWPCCLSGGEGFLSKTTGREPREPPISKVQRSGVPPGGRGSHFSLIPTPTPANPAAATLRLQAVKPKPRALDGSQRTPVPLAFCPQMLCAAPSGQLTL